MTESLAPLCADGTAGVWRVLLRAFCEGVTLKKKKRKEESALLLNALL